MGKQTPQAPTPPDPAELARLQAQYSLINQQTPFGSLTYSSNGGGNQGGVFGDFNASDPFAAGGGDVPDNGLSFQQEFLINQGGGTVPGAPTSSAPLGAGSITATQTLTPELQALLDSQIANTQGMANLASNAQRDIGNLSGDRVRDSLLKEFNQLTGDQFQQNESRLRQSLADRGLPVGSEAFNDEISLMRKNQGLMRNQAAFDAIQAGGAEESRQFNQLAALMGGQQVQVPTLGNFMAPGGVDALGASALGQQGAMNNYNAQLAQNNAKKGGATQMGSAALMAAMMSSKALKEEIGEGFEIESDDVIDRLGNLLLKLKSLTTDPRILNIPVKAWRYLWDDAIHVGPYAEDFAKVFGGDGKTIRYADYLKVLDDGIAALEAA